MDGYSYSYWMYRLWVCLLVTKTVAIEAATRSLRALATSKGPTVSGKQEEAQKPVRKVTAVMKEDAVRKVAGLNPGAGKVFSRKVFSRKISAK